MKAAKNDDLILSALLSTPTVREAAEKAGVTERTIYHRLENEDFRQRYESERRLLIDKSASALQMHLAEAIDTMSEICIDKEASKQARLTAAENIIKYSLKLTERADVLDRLDALERGNQ